MFCGVGVMMDFKLVTKNLLETYLGSDTLNKVAIQNFLDANVSIIGTGKQEFFKNIDHFLSSFKFDMEKRKNIHFEFKDLEIEENVVDDQCVFTYGSVQIYGIFDKEEVALGLVRAVGIRKGIDVSEMEGVDFAAFKETQYDILASELRKHLDMKKIYEILEQGI